MIFLKNFFKSGNVKQNPHSSIRKGRRIVVMLQLGEQKVAGGRSACMQSAGRGTRRHMHTDTHKMLRRALTENHRCLSLCPADCCKWSFLNREPAAANIPCIMKVILSHLFLLPSACNHQMLGFLPRYWTFALIFCIINSSAGPRPNIYAQQK